MNKTISNLGNDIATQAQGEPTWGTILLTMGATASMVWWPSKMIELLSAAGYRVIRFDHRDTGMSTTNSPGDVKYNITDLVSDLLAILDAYDAQKVHLVGMSLGGYLSQIFALKHPDRVKTLTIIASEPLGLEYEGTGISPEFMEHFGKMEELDWSDTEAVTSFMLKIAKLSAGTANVFDEASALERIETELERTQSIQSAFNHSAIEDNVDPALTAEAIRCPTLIVHGTEDPVISVNAANLTAQSILGSKLMLLEKRGHELLEEDAIKITDGILELLGLFRSEKHN